MPAALIARCADAEIEDTPAVSRIEIGVTVNGIDGSNEHLAPYLEKMRREILKEVKRLAVRYDISNTSAEQ